MAHNIFEDCNFGGPRAPITHAMFDDLARQLAEAQAEIARLRDETKSIYKDMNEIAMEYRKAACRGDGGGEKAAIEAAKVNKNE